MKAVFISILSLVFLNIFSQEIPVDHLDEVVVYSHFSPEYQFGYHIEVLSDSILKNNNESLSHMLKKYGGAYIKEQGSGMLASIALRGSGASHTAVYWNGIPVNSSLNGQTDFNSLFSSAFNKISIRKGGGSVLLGSGAIGGAVNLENELLFNTKTNASIFGSLGSYQSYSTAIHLNHSTHKIAIQIGLNGLKSKNNYPFYNSKLYNENGEVNTYSLQLNTGYKFNTKHRIYIKLAHNNSDRNTSRTLYATNNANLIYKTQNLLTGWSHKNSHYQSEFKIAFLKENYRYVFNKVLPDVFSENTSQKWFSNYDFKYKFNTKIQLQSGINYEQIKGNGSDIETSKRTKIALFTALHHKLSKTLMYNLNIRKDWSSLYSIPIVFSLDTKLQWHKNYNTKFNFSTNYRIPTINDLYWQPGGNIHLKPENNWSAELGQGWKLPIGLQTITSEFNISSFTSNSTNLIQWRPAADMIWKPVNVQKVNTYGLELGLKASIQKDKHSIKGNTYYSYTVSKNPDTKKQLIYIPYHLAGIQVAYSYKNWHLDLDQHYTGSVFTTSTNTVKLPHYWLLDINTERRFFNQKLIFTIRANNLLNKKYQVVASRPMPGRNFKINIQYKF